MTKTTEFTTDPLTLVSVAAEALLGRKFVRMALPPDWTRPHNFPLPVSRQPAGEPQSYRPLAILEWVDSELRGENKGRAMSERHAAAKTEGAAA